MGGSHLVYNATTSSISSMEAITRIHGGGYAVVVESACRWRSSSGGCGGRFSEPNENALVMFIKGHYLRAVFEPFVMQTIQ